ncbi:MAG: thioredoxin [Myxococcales bacterium]|nr:thioredoxin [Myxococcales bacterium]
MMTAQYVFEATDVDFQEKVLLRSREVPVLVDLWAPWCGPCKTLGPALEKLANEYRGAFELVKINVDESPQVAMAFRVQSIPTVYLFQDGQPLDGFQGALTEPQLRKFLDRHVKAPEADPLEVAREAFAAGHSDEAARAWRKVLAATPNHGEALLGMARVALSEGDTGAALSWIDRVEEGDPQFEAANRLRGVLDFGADAGVRIDLEAATQANPGDVEAWYGLGATCALEGDLPSAFAAFLEVVSRDRSFREDAGRKALLSLFDLIGHNDPLVISTRRRLASLLF